MASKLYKTLRGKQNKGCVLAMEKQSIARNNRLDSSTIAGCITRGDNSSLHREILLEMCFKTYNCFTVLLQCYTKGH